MNIPGVWAEKSPAPPPPPPPRALLNDPAVYPWTSQVSGPRKVLPPPPPPVPCLMTQLFTHEHPRCLGREESCPPPPPPCALLNDPAVYPWTSQVSGPRRVLPPPVPCLMTQLFTHEHPRCLGQGRSWSIHPSSALPPWRGARSWSPRCSSPPCRSSPPVLSLACLRSRLTGVEFSVKKEERKKWHIN